MRYNSVLISIIAIPKGLWERGGDETMLGRATLTLTFAAITAVVIALEASGALAAPKKTAVSETVPIQCEAGKVCKGTSGEDLIYGSPGNDNINPFGGNDTVYAGEGNDYVHHSYGDDIIHGGPGADTLRGGFGDDTIYGNEPAESLDPEDVPDGAHDLVDCAYLSTRGDTGVDVDKGYGEPKPTDTVVDCSNRDDQ
jgi:Ca2+-binding RTX toxin-like protein